MPYFRNKTTKVQHIYNINGQLISVKPGETVNSEKLGRSPSEGEGFEPCGMIASILAHESESSQTASLPFPPPTEKPKATINLESLPLKEQITRDQVRVDPEENSPQAAAAIAALLNGQAPKAPVIPPTLPPKRSHVQVKLVTGTESEFVPVDKDPLVSFFEQNREAFVPSPMPVRVVSVPAEAPAAVAPVMVVTGDEPLRFKRV